MPALVGQSAVIGDVVVGGIAAGLGTEGLTVVFSNPDGSLIGTELTDAKGAASRTDCVPDTMITAVIPRNLVSATGSVVPHDVVTYTGVQVGDTVYFGSSVAQIFEDPYSDLNVTTSADVSAFPGASEVYIRNGCNQDETEPGALATMPLWPYCLSNDTVDVLALLIDEDGEAIAYAEAKDVSVVKGTISTRGSTVVNLGAWQAASATNALILSDLPDGSSSANAFMEQRVDDAIFGSTAVGMSGGDFVSSSTFVGVPAEFGARSVSDAVAYFFGGPFLRGFIMIPIGYSVQALTEVARAQDFADTVNAGMAQALPRLAGVVVTTEETGRPAVHWLSDGPLTGANAAIVAFDIFDANLLLARWFVLTPDASAGMVQAPALPESTLAVLAPPTASTRVQPAAAAILSMGWQSYGDMITRDGFFPFPILYGDFTERWISMPTTGSALYRRTVWKLMPGGPI